MKGKNRPSRKYRKKKTNIIEEKKVGSSLLITFRANPIEFPVIATFQM